MPIDVSSLVSSVESRALDFKGAYWDDRADVVHDILCMANSLVQGPRYIVIGVDDRTRLPVRAHDGSYQSAPRNERVWNLEKITGLFVNKRANAVPELHLESASLGGVTVDVLIIQDGHFKPYFLGEDLEGDKSGSAKQKKIRKGVIYIRNNDTNTPTNGTATDAEMQSLWARRLGVGIPPITKASSYLRDVPNWRKTPGTEPEVIHYQPAPEYTIRLNSHEPIKRVFSERWTASFPDPQASSFYIDVLFHSTIIKRETYVSVDGHRHIVPMPHVYSTGGEATYFLNPNRMYMSVWRVVTRHSLLIPIDQVDQNIKTFIGRSGVSIEDREISDQ